MTFRVFLGMSGKVDREQFSRCYEQAGYRHPLLNCRVDDSSGTAVWKACTVQAPKLNWRSFESLDGCPAHGLYPLRLPLKSVPGLHTDVFTLPDGIGVRLDFHHACCDGQGARQFLANWLHFYDCHVHGKEPGVTRLEPDRLEQRGVIRSRPGIEPVRFREGLRNFYATVSGPTTRLPKRSIPDDEDIPGGAHLCERPLTEQQTAVLRRRLRDANITINDLGIAVTMFAIARLYPSLNSRHYITVLNPADLRMPSDRFMPAANRTGFAYLRRRLGSCTNLRQLVSSVHEEMKYIKSRYIGAEFVHGLTAASRWPGLLWLIRKSGIFTPTIQFTCLGEATRGKRYGLRQVDGGIGVGDLNLDHISGFAPVAPGVPFSVTACETNARLSITVGAGQQFASRADGEMLADSIVRSILTFAEAAEL